MILKGSQRGGPRQLAAHLLNIADNDHVAVEELRGFVACGLHGAMAETEAVAKGTRCVQPVFSLSLNPPKEAEASIDDLRAAADCAEAALGLIGRPRALVIHEKNGRRHAHVVWSRIDAAAMKAINLPHFKNRLTTLSRELYLEHGWNLPDGLKTNGWKSPLNFTLSEWQQAKRLDLDPRELKQLFNEAWERSDGLKAYRSALEEHGFFLARGDRRGFVALDVNGETFSLSRWSGVKPKALVEKLGAPGNLPSVEQAQADIGKRLSQGLRNVIAEGRAAQAAARKPLLDERRAMVAAQRLERLKLARGQKSRWAKESADRASRFRAGFGKVLDILTGRAFAIRKENARDAWAGLQRDQAQREALVGAQALERKALQARLEALQRQQRAERARLVRKIMTILPDRDRPERVIGARDRSRGGPGLEL